MICMGQRPCCACGNAAQHRLQGTLSCRPWPDRSRNARGICERRRQSPITRGTRWPCVSTRALRMCVPRTGYRKACARTSGGWRGFAMIGPASLGRLRFALSAGWQLAMVGATRQGRFHSITDSRDAQCDRGDSGDRFPPKPSAPSAHTSCSLSERTSAITPARRAPTASGSSCSTSNGGSGRRCLNSIRQRAASSRLEP